MYPETKLIPKTEIITVPQMPSKHSFTDFIDPMENAIHLAFYRIFIQ